MSLSIEELRRYNRHIILPEIGIEGQEKLKSSKVLVIGAGGLGCPVLQYIAAAGVGTIGILDFDTVSESNLHRQILFSTDDIGEPKASVAAKKLSIQNPYCQYQIHETKLNRNNALEIFKPYDIIIDGSDNFPTRYLVNDACVILGKPLVFGSIFKFDGQVSVFNYKGGPTYRCLFPDPPQPEDVPSCSQVGVMGVLPGLIGTMQASETIKIITGIGEPLIGKLFYFNALNMNSHTLEFDRNESVCEIKELIDYEDFCGDNVQNNVDEIKSLSVDELAEKIHDDIQIIDVREPFECDICKIENAILIPLSQIDLFVSKLNRSKQTVVYCHHGMRSASAIKHLQNEYGFNNLYNLDGGIDEWACEIDTQMERY